MPDLYVWDTVLTIPASRGGIRTVAAHPKRKEKPVMRSNGELTVRKVSQEEMAKLWK